jgi:hypothetical protein
MGKAAKMVALIFISIRVIAKSGFQEQNENQRKTLASSCQKIKGQKASILVFLFCFCVF